MIGKLKNKRADATDVFIIVIIVFFLAIAFIVGIFINSNISTIISTTALNESAAYSSIKSNLDYVNTVGVQRAFLVMFAFMIIFTMASAFLVRVHPVFLFLYVLTTFVTILTSVFLSNTYGLLADNPTLGPVIAQQTIITYFASKLPYIAVGTGLFSMIVVFTKLFGAPTGGDNF